ncbi:PAS domain-containing transcriptional regulator [Geomesophilobacter sediminis]|uniref:LytTR family transcriptional regulator DNA-binding domain-containing protein n=1 Tax=Geomesophilobacter sediminis TaxID=2798584 RepID=A0A8J7M043_9BACT|nr:PAS domain-containing transcriptional regulator [Geomesophilobacter sediminis]MBJ6723237.1 LytTR family transcriptional regulator DNA-binding domain-containing protein [Geomesophilobacter sediminis]
MSYSRGTISSSDDLNFGLVLLSDDFTVVGMNQCALQIVGNQTGPLGKDLLGFHQPKTREKVRGLLQELTEPADTLQNTLVLDFLGRVLMMSMSRMTVSTAEGAASWSVIFVDVTEQTGALTNPVTGHLELKKLPVHENGNFIFLSADEVRLIQADGNYCRIFTGSKRHYLLMSLKTALEKLPGNGFFRVHKSFIVNLKHVRGIEHGDGSRLLVSFDDPAIPKVPVSCRLAPALKKALGQ